MASSNFTEEIAALYKKEAPKMQSYARRRLPDPDDAEDAVNETFASLSALGSLSGITNPSAWLMTALNRIILEALRKKYRLQRQQAKGTFTSETECSDVADEYERAERDSLIRESVEALDPDQRRILELYSLSYKPSEIALIESETGSPTTSRQVTVALYEAWPKLASQFRKKGVLPAAIPFAWLLPRLRTRIRGAAFRIGELLRVLEPAAAISTLALISLMPLTPGERLHPAGSSPANSAQANEMVRNPESPVAANQRPGSKSSEGRPKTNSSSAMEVDLADEQHRFDQWDDYEDRPSPSLTDQLLAIIEDPGSVPAPECGGLPICP